MKDENELPGMLHVQIGVRSQTFPHTVDAKVWAEEWLKTIKNHPQVPFDEATMIGWFANAIMAGYDTAVSRMKQK